MMYYSDRVQGPRARVEEQVSERPWGGIVVAVQARVTDGSFGGYYPSECPDGQGIDGTNERRLSLSLGAEIPDLGWPLNPHVVPPTLVILDLIEFCHRIVAAPVAVSYHGFYGHSHLSFDTDRGQAAFREEINRILARNGLVYELQANGEVIRLAPEGLRESLTSAIFKTEDAELNALLETARRKYLDPDLNIRRESLEKLWDAWERLKTLEAGKDKAESATALLNRTANEPTFWDALDKEARELTRIGNTFQIRHTETTQVPVATSEHVDYLFHRLFAFIRLLLKATGRGG